MSWIKIHRSVMEHWLWQDAERLKWWLDLLFMAAWEDKQTLHDSHLFTLKRGQIIASANNLAKRWKRSKHTIINYLRMLEDEEMITREVLHRQTPIITICNYDSYQAGLHPILHPIAHSQNRENLGSAVDTQFSDVTPIQSDNLGGAEESELHPILHPQMHSILHPYKEYKNNISVVVANNAPTRESVSVQEFKSFQNLSIDDKLGLLKTSPIWLQEICYKHKIDAYALNNKLIEFRSHCICEAKTHQSESDLKRHFSRWLSLELTKSANPYGTTSTPQPNNLNREQRDREFAELIARNAPRGSN